MAENPEALTVREREVRLIALGQSTLEIGATLVIAEGPVERHVTNLHGKIVLAVAQTQQPTRFAIGWSWSILPR